MKTLKDNFIASGGKWEEYELGKLFVSSNGDTDIQKQHINNEGELVVSSGEYNQGIIGKSNIPAKLFNPHTITVDMFGNTYYRDFTYKMVTHARVFSLKNLDENIKPKGLIYISSLLKFLKQIYAFENMASWKMIKDTKILLPTTFDDEIAYDFIEEYITILEKEQLEELKNQLKANKLDSTTLTKDEQLALDLFRDGKIDFQRRTIGEMFDVEKTWTYGKNKKWTKTSTSPLLNCLPVVSGTTINNGINYYTKDIPNTTEVFRDCLTISTRGEYSGTVFYHDGEFVLANNILTMPMPNLTKRAKIFIGTLIDNLGYDGYDNYPRKKTLNNDSILVPVNDEGLNYDFMENFIAAQEKIVLKGVFDYIDSTI